jgi:hypothetical protein
MCHSKNNVTLKIIIVLIIHLYYILSRERITFPNFMSVEAVNGLFTDVMGQIKHKRECISTESVMIPQRLQASSMREFQADPKDSKFFPIKTRSVNCEAA